MIILIVIGSIISVGFVLGAFIINNEEKKYGRN